MIDSFIAYFERLELMAFFSGYPLIYALVNYIAGSKVIKRLAWASRLQQSLPKAYALTGTIFLLLWIRAIIMQFQIRNADHSLNLGFLKIWALLSVFFWIPALARKPLYSLLHSLVFFLLLLKDLITGMGSPSGRDNISNDMNVYTVSLVIQAISLVIVFGVSRILGKNLSHR